MSGGWIRSTRAAYACVAASVGLSLWGANALPAGSRIATHFDASGEADGFTSRDEVLVGGPLLLAVLVGILIVAPNLEPRRGRELRDVKLYQAAVVTTPVLLVAVYAMILLRADGWDIDPSLVTGVGIGVLFVVLGNYAPKTPSNWFAGIRTPWTLSSERSWRMTHRLTGRAFVVAGAATIVVALVDPTASVAFVSTAAIVISVGAIAYSYAIWRQDPDRRRR